MSQYGKYNPSESQHGSSLFGYGEVPVSSNKLNTWNGNIDAALSWLAQCLSILCGGQAEDFILEEGAGEELKVVAQSPPAMAVTVNEGKALVALFFAGLDAAENVPATGFIEAPSENPRYDRVHLDSFGSLGVSQGEESASPVPPDGPAGTVSLALLYLRPGMTSIQNEDDSANGYIVDDRPRALLGLAHRHNADRLPVESPDGIETDFSTESKFVEGSLDVYVNGILQESGIAFTPHTDRHGYTFASAPPAEYRVEHRYLIEQS